MPHLIYRDRTFCMKGVFTDAARKVVRNGAQILALPHTTQGSTQDAFLTLFMPSFSTKK